MAKVIATRVLWGEDLVSIGVSIEVDNHTTEIYSNIVHVLDIEQVQHKIDVANSTAMCCVMALNACGIEAELHTLD